MLVLLMREEEKLMEAQALAYTTNYASVVFKLLIECLEANGALLPGQFQKALRGTIGHLKAEQIGSIMYCTPSF